MDWVYWILAIIVKLGVMIGLWRNIDDTCVLWQNRILKKEYSAHTLIQFNFPMFPIRWRNTFPNFSWPNITAFGKTITCWENKSSLYFRLRVLISGWYIKLSKNENGSSKRRSRQCFDLVKNSCRKRHWNKNRQVISLTHQSNYFAAINYIQETTSTSLNRAINNHKNEI